MIEHPVITNMELTGYPDGKEPEAPRCPVCGEVCDLLYQHYDSGEIVGCDGCIATRDAYDYFSD